MLSVGSKYKEVSECQEDSDEHTFWSSEASRGVEHFMTLIQPLQIGVVKYGNNWPQWEQPGIVLTMLIRAKKDNGPGGFYMAKCWR